MNRKQHQRWLKELYASGYAGITTTGEIVDRRAYPDAEPLQANALHGIASPLRKFEEET